MVLGDITKTGFWRTNPMTGEREFIEQSNQPKQPKIEEPTQITPPVVAQVEEPIAPRKPEERVSPLISSRELFEIDVQRENWWKEYQKTGLYPQEPKDEILQPFYEQWLQGVIAWEKTPAVVQRREALEALSPYKTVAGTYDLSLARAGGVAEEYLTLLFGESVISEPQPSVGGSEIETTIRNIWPELFDLAASFGMSVSDLPAAAVETIRSRMAGDYAGFVADLYNRVDQAEAENILRLFGVSEGNILLTLDFKEQESRVSTIISSVFPDFRSTETFNQLIETDWELFVDTIQYKGSTKEKRALLEFMGYDPMEINQFFSTIKITQEVDGVTELLTIDVANKKAYDQDGNWVGTYNVVTREFADLPDEGFAKDVWDTFYYGGQHLYHQSKQFMVSALPNFLFLDSFQWERDLYGDDWADAVNADNQKIRDNFRRVYTLNQNEFERWEAEHPELAPPEFARVNIVDRLKADPLKTIIYEFASTAPFMLAVMGTTIAVTAATGNPILGIAAGAAMATPPQAQDAHDALLDAGATEQQAGILALPIGLVMSAIETVGDMPYLRQVLPAIFKVASKGIIKEVSKQTLASLAKKGIKTFTMIEITESIEEVLQDAVLNAGIRTFNENQEIFEGVGDTILRTLAATAPLAVFGAGASLRRVSASQTRGRSDTELIAQGYQKDPKTGNWYQRLRDVIKEEGGFVVPGEFLPEEPEVPSEAFIFQDTNQEKIIHQEWQATSVRFDLEGAGDIFRELTNPSPDSIYLSEKIKRIEDLISRTEKGTLVEGAALSDAIQKDSEKVNKLLELWGKQPVTTSQQEAAKQLNIALLKNDIVSAKRLIEEVLPPVIPTAEPGMPEAGLQPPLIPGVEPVEVRPPGKGKIVQISMEDQLKLDQAREAVEEASAEDKETYEAQAEIEALKVTHGMDPVVTTKFKLGGKNVELDSFISIREQAFPSYFTIKQAQAIKPNINTTPYSQPGTPLYNKIPRTDVLDELADKWGMTTDEIAERVMAIRQEKRQLKDFEATIASTMKATPVVPATELTTAEVTENWHTVGQPKLNMKQIDALNGAFAEYLNNPNLVTAWEMTRELRRETRTKRAESMKARAQELIVKEGLATEVAINQAISETMKGELPTVTTEYLEAFTSDMREALFAKLYHILLSDLVRFCIYIHKSNLGFVSFRVYKLIKR